VFAFAVAVLAAYGVDVAIRADRAGRRRLLAVGTAVAGLPVAGWLALHPSILGSAGTALDQFPTLRPYTTSPDAAALGAVLRFAVLAGAALALLALVRGPRTRVALAAGAVALTLADVATLGRGYFPAVSHEVAAAPPPPAATGARVDRRLAGRGGALLPNLAVRYELLDARVQDLPELERYTRLWGDLGGDVVSDLGITTVGDATPVDSPLLDVFSVRHLLAGDPLVSIENPDAFPRAWFATSWRTADSLDAALERVRTTPAAQLRRGPVIEGAPPSRPATGPAGTARIRRSEDTRVEVAVTAPRAGYLILDDVHYPGWEAEVDGRAAPVRPANAAFRAVPVPAGRHVVVFRYRSATLAWGSRLSLAGLALVAAGLLAGLVRDRRRRA
jgi:hypothetical protein